MRIKSKLVFGALIGACITLGANQVYAAVQKQNFEVVGTWGFLENWKQFEKKFWTEMLPNASGGKLTANAKPYTELGLKGYEVMSGLKKGAYDAVHALTSYSAKASPALEGIDLAGVIQDFGTYRKAGQAYRPIIEREIKDKYNGKVINIYPFPSQQLWCNLGDKSISEVPLSSLAGKKNMWRRRLHAPQIQHTCTAKDATMNSQHSDHETSTSKRKRVKHVAWILNIKKGVIIT